MTPALALFRRFGPRWPLGGAGETSGPHLRLRAPCRFRASLCAHGEASGLRAPTPRRGRVGS
eukprot:11841138-Alexandrium_andersonii.AAC.1